MDFGISQASWRPRLTEGERVAGTPQYMAPEQAQGLREQIDHRSDQFSLAAIAYTLLTGREPFSGDDPIAVLYQVVHQQPPAPVKIVPALGQAVNDAIMRGLAKASDDRFPDVMEFAGALRAAVEAIGARAVDVAVETNELVASPIDVAPPVRAPAIDAAVEGTVPLPADVALPVPADIDPTPFPPGQETKRLIRRMRRKNRAPMRIALLAVVAGLGALSWFHPATRGPTRAAWQQIAGEAHGLIDSVASRTAPR
jgi:serine/threonine protein kinase